MTRVGGRKPRADRTVTADQLQRDDAVFELVVRLVDRTEAAATEQTTNRIASRDALGRITSVRNIKTEIPMQKIKRSTELPIRG